MTRAEAAAYIGERWGEYLLAADRTASDGSGKTLKPALDDSLRALGYAAVGISTAAPTDPEDEEDLRVQVAYRAMAQISRDLATSFDVSTGGDSYRLSQMRAAAEKDLALTALAVLERFRTLAVVSTDGRSAVTTLEYDFPRSSSGLMAIRPNPLLPTGAVASLDRLLGRFREDVCQVKRRGVSRDAGGAPITSAYGVVDTLDCQVRSVNRAANEFVVGGRLTALADYEIVVSRDADIREADRIAVNSKTYEVVNVPNEATHGLTLIVAVKLAT